jgi:RNA polymerase sigma factor for flagellar operon FliA
MSDQLFEVLFLEHLGWIEKVAAMMCNKNGMRGAEAEDFSGWVKMRLIEDDYAAFRRFRGEAQVQTYLATVIVRLFHDYQREHGGRWRPSAAAIRLGPPAPELEALVYRDRYQLHQAGEHLRTTGRTTLSDTELARLLAQVPIRGPLTPMEVAADLLMEVEGSMPADALVAASEAEAERENLMGALNRAMDQLDPEDHTIVRML